MVSTPLRLGGWCTLGALDCWKGKEGRNGWGHGIHPFWGCSSLRWRVACHQNKIPMPLTAGPTLVSSGFAHSLWKVVVTGNYSTVVKCTGFRVRISECEPWLHHLRSMISGKFLMSLRLKVLNRRMEVVITSHSVPRSNDIAHITGMNQDWHGVSAW